MHKIVTKDLILGIMLIGILCACYYPLMPGNMNMMLHTALVIGFGIFAFFLWTEKPQDEREEQHRAFASRTAFTLCSMVMVIGIVYQGIVMNHIDGWLSIAFGALLVGKTLGRLWAHYRY